MKILIGFIALFAILNAFAAEDYLLLQDRENDELVLVKDPQFKKSIEKPADDELSEIDEHFSLRRSSRWRIYNGSMS